MKLGKRFCAFCSRRRILRFLLVGASTFCARSVHGGDGAPTPLTTVRVAWGLTEPLFVTHAPEDHRRVFIVEQGGKIKILKNGVLLASPFLNLERITSSGGEQGLLGLAFHPDYAINGQFFINYTDTSGRTTLARYTVSSDPDLANPTGEILLLIPQPYSNHNGGWLGFGPDGYLYVATGDGGDGGDPLGTGQNNEGDLLGNLLRIDVNGDDFPDDELRDYAIPPDNPFVNLPGEDEIWAFGLRNPWRCAFDRDTGDLYIGDVGQGDREEINFQPAFSDGGTNYGWRCMEGTICTSFGQCDCESLESVLPVFEYDHGQNPNVCSVTGGDVYRGCAIGDLVGTYFFGDFCSGTLWSMRVVDGVAGDLRDRTTELDPEGLPNVRWISSFGRDADGELYICDLFDGEVFKIVSNPPLALVESNPPDGAIDARRPVDVDGVTALGWSQIDYTFNKSSECVGVEHYGVSQDGGLREAPTVVTVKAGDAGATTVVLNRVIEPKAWTSVYHGESRSVVRIAALPGDVDADGTSDAFDIARLVGVLGGEEAALPLWSADIDRSGRVAAPDVLSAIDLLTGATGGEAFLNTSLP